jgi:hypothetical protein
MWLGARQAAACRRLSRMSISLRIVLSGSSALVTSICRSMRGRPSQHEEKGRGSGVGLKFLTIGSDIRPAGVGSDLSARAANLLRGLLH